MEKCTKNREFAEKFPIQVLFQKTELYMTSIIKINTMNFMGIW